MQPVRRGFLREISVVRMTWRPSVLVRPLTDMVHSFMETGCGAHQATGGKGSALTALSSTAAGVSVPASSPFCSGSVLTLLALFRGAALAPLARPFVVLPFFFNGLSSSSLTFAGLPLFLVAGLGVDDLDRTCPFISTPSSPNPPSPSFSTSSSSIGSPSSSTSPVGLTFLVLVSDLFVKHSAAHFFKLDLRPLVCIDGFSFGGRKLSCITS